MKRILSVLALIGATSLSAQAADRDYITIVGSSTVYPFATVVAEQFGKTTEFKTPKIESTGSGGGLKLFCSGVGLGHPDITNSSRAIKKSEVERCSKHGVKDIVEVKIGYDGIVLANAKNAPDFNLTLRDIYLALAKDVPNPDGSQTFVRNPYVTWADVRSELPNTRIEVLGPPPTSGTRDAFAELALEGGAKTFDWVKVLKKVDKKVYKSRAHTVREDGAYVEAGENDNLIVQKLQTNPVALGVFGFSFLDQNTDVIKGSPVGDIAPEFESIADGSYPISRPLFFYVKKVHVGKVPGLEEYLAEFTSERSWGDEGYLSDRGLISMPEEERAEVSARVRDLETL